MELLHALCVCCAGCQIKKTLAGCGLTMCTRGPPHRFSQQTMERCLTPPPNWKPHLHSFHLEELVSERCLLHHHHPQPLHLQTELFRACGHPLHQPRCLRASHWICRSRFCHQSSAPQTIPKLNGRTGRFKGYPHLASMYRNVPGHGCTAHNIHGGI